MKVRLETKTGWVEIEGEQLTIQAVEAFDLRYEIRRRGLSAAAFCREAGIAVQTLNRCMVHNQVPRPATIKRIADFLETDVETVRCGFMQKQEKGGSHETE